MTTDEKAAPTGCRLIYPLVGPPEYVLDVLGIDEPPEGWPADPPTARRVAEVERHELERERRRDEMAREAARYAEADGHKPGVAAEWRPA